MTISSLKIPQWQKIFITIPDGIITVKSLTKRAGVGSSMTYKSLQEFISHGWITKDKDKKYKLTTIGKVKRTSAIEFIGDLSYAVSKHLK